MEKKSGMKKVNRWDVQSVVVGVIILFSILTAVCGYESLSLSNVMILALFCVLGGIADDLKELCNGLTEEE